MSKFIKFFLVIDLFVINGVAGYLLYKFQITNYPTSPAEQVSLGAGKSQTDERYELLESRISQLENKQLIPAPTLAAAPTIIEKTTNVVKAAPKAKTRTMQYVTVPGMGSSSGGDWENLAGTDFYLDTADYPGLVEVYFEASVKLFNGNGMAYVRLYDVNHGIGVQGSEITTNSQIDVISISGKVSFWAGKNLIRVQAKSLTADTTIYNYGRLRVVTEN